MQGCIQLRVCFNHNFHRWMRYLHLRVGSSLGFESGNRYESIAAAAESVFADIKEILKVTLPPCSSNVPHFRSHSLAPVLDKTSNCPNLLDSTVNCPHGPGYESKTAGIVPGMTINSLSSSTASCFRRSDGVAPKNEPNCVNQSR